jgi:two-component system, chemotaxis family, chemotaxis protein CheY
MAEKKILVVDDSATMRQLLVMSLRKLDGAGQLELVEAVDGEDAYAKLKADAFALVMTDINMPGMDGLELVSRLRNELGNRTVPVVIITTRGEEADVQRGLQIGADDYLLKPISGLRLKAVVAKLLQGRAAAGSP